MFKITPLFLTLILSLMACFASADEQFVQALPQAAAASSVNVGSSVAATPSPSASFAVAKPTVNVAALDIKAKSAQNLPGTANAQEAAVLMSKLMQLNQSLMQYQQNINGQYAGLKTTTTSLQQQLGQLAQVVQTLNQQVQNLQGMKSQITSLSSSIQAQQNQSLIAGLKAVLTPEGFYGASAAILLLLLALAYFAWPKKTQVQAKAVDSDKPDYDYMATSDAMPVKMDLARAYIAMGDTHLAKQALQEVVSHAQDELKDQAKTLLASLEEKADA